MCPVTRVLFGWELGANLGHVGLLAEIARRLVTDGVEVTVAATDLTAARIGFAGIGVRLLQAPQWAYHRHLGSETGQAGYQDLLTMVGFADPVKLSAVVEGWTSLIDLLQPDLILADHAPGLMVATHQRGIAVMAIGSGYTLPPLDLGRLPPLRADRSPLLPEARLLASVAAALAPRKVTAPEALVDVFQAGERFVFGIPELDPYRPYRSQPLYAPPGLPVFVEPPIQPHLFVYLGEDMPHLDVLAKVLGEVDHAVTAYFRGDVGLIPDFLERRGHTVHRAPPRLDEVLPAASHVLHAGGLFTAVAAVAAGRPQLVIPLHDETRVNVQMLGQLGVVRQMPPTAEAHLLSSALHGFIRDHTMPREARHWAKVVAMRRQPGVDDVVSGLRRRLARAG